jgi:RNA polymerase sigma-70 factor (ECF subfamily)
MGSVVDSVMDADIQSGHARIRHLYQQYWKELCRYVSATFGRGPPDPEDVAQAAFARFMALGDQETVSNPRAFLYATARNIVVDFNRRVRTVNRHAAATAHGATDERVDDLSPERIALACERASLITATITNLPPRQRQALLLHRLHGLSYSEIAARTGGSKSDVRRQIARALAAVEAALELAE